MEHIEDHGNEVVIACGLHIRTFVFLKGASGDSTNSNRMNGRHMPNTWVLVKIIPGGIEDRGKTELEKREYRLRTKSHRRWNKNLR